LQSAIDNTPENGQIWLASGTYHPNIINTHFDSKFYCFFRSDSQDIILLKQKTKELFGKGLKAYFEKRFTDGAGYFKKVLIENPADSAAEIYLNNCAHNMVNGVPDDWNGIYKFNSK